MALPIGIPIQSSAATAAIAPPRSFVWTEKFDATLLVAPVVLGLLAAAFVTSNPAWYAAVVLADLWFLGYHHIVSTYTRLGFSSKSLLRNRVLAVYLLLAVVLATTTLAFTAGAWVVASAFLYLQWFHYMRQGYGISRMYFRTTSDGQTAGARDLSRPRHLRRARLRDCPPVDDDGRHVPGDAGQDDRAAGGGRDHARRLPPRWWWPHGLSGWVIASLSAPPMCATRGSSCRTSSSFCAATY